MKGEGAALGGPHTTGTRGVGKGSEGKTIKDFSPKGVVTQKNRGGGKIV